MGRPPSSASPAGGDQVRVRRLTAIRAARAGTTASRSAGHPGSVKSRSSQAAKPVRIAARAPGPFAPLHQMPAVRGTKRVASSTDQESTIRS